MVRNHSERTRLLSHVTQPNYVFETTVKRRRRIRQFQCCLCVMFIFAFTIATVITVAYSISSNNNEVENVTDINSLPIILANTWPIADKKTETEICKNQTQWNEANSLGERALTEKNKIAKHVKPVASDSPSYKHQKIFAYSNKSQALGDLGYKQEFARRYFPTTRSKICNENQTNLTYCIKIKCNVFQKFRTYNGSCNNIKNPQFGIAFQAFRRALPPDYADGISKPRVSKNGSQLPSARTVSLEVHRPFYKEDKQFSVILAVWGQFLDHDITATSLNHGLNGSSISCCLSDQIFHSECFPVMLDDFDPFRMYNMTCMEFVRSAPAPTCCLGHREQMNQVTSFIDGSVIYGVDEESVKNLRTMTGGKLQMYITEDNRTLLPVSKDPGDGCNRKEENEKGRYCFLTGDVRANENLHLTSMHLIWARQHNLLAEKLASLNPGWSDERLFQEARKISGAQMQHITYREFLPILLGSEVMIKFDLYPQTSAYFSKYNDTVDASVANHFATAAFRFAHSIIPGLMKFLALNDTDSELIRLHKMLFDPFKLYQPGELDRTLKSAMDTRIQASDPYFTDELKQHLFENDSPHQACGLDLVSLNIQRGRDHGLPSYNSWREHCGLQKVVAFRQLQGILDDDSFKNIQSVYRDVEDVDLYTGGLSEKPINGSILGPTITCLILDQFIRIKYGDRFWYENPNWFTLEQLQEVRKTSLARIICDNADNMEEVQPLVMKKLGDDNRLLPCDTLPEPSMRPWKETLPRINLSDDKISVNVRN